VVGGIGLMGAAAMGVCGVIERDGVGRRTLGC